MSPTLRGPSQSDVGVIIPSGGQGVRAGAGIPKQFREIAGVPMLLHSVRLFASLARVREIVIPLPHAYVDEPPPWLAVEINDRIRVVAGGETRPLSVLNGVRALSPRCTHILIHDAARPCVSEQITMQIIEIVASGTCAIAAARVQDTVKRSDNNGLILETIPRENLWHAQTPQGFPREILTKAYDILTDVADTSVLTDEASVVERAGFPVKLVQDAATNLKVTTADDFRIAEALMAR